MASIKGKWVWNDVVKCNWLIAHPGSYDISFVSNGKRFSGIATNWVIGYHTLYYFNENTSVTVGESKAENENFYTVDKAYRFMNFGEEQPVDDVLYEFIIQNAHEITMSEKYVYIAENEQKVFEAGKQAEYDAFWDEFQRNGTLTNYANVFSGPGWTNKTFIPKYNLTPTYAYMMFRDAAITGDLDKILADAKVSLITDDLYDSTYMFSMCALSRIGVINFPSCNTLNNTFTGCKKLKEIGVLHAKENMQFNNPFSQCEALEKITIEGVIGQDINFQSSTLLSRASIESIITHLSSGASGKTLTLSSAAVNAAFPDDWDSYVTEYKPAGWQIQLS